MKHFFIMVMLTLMPALVAGCTEDCEDGSCDTVDAAPVWGPHDQTAYCDERWEGVSVCSHACVVKPAEPPCSPGDGPCYRRLGCLGARSPSASKHDCDQTFLTTDGLFGCCLVTGEAPWQPAGNALFFECPALAPE